MAIALEKLEDELNCSVCLETYTNPKQLQCHHVFCKKCLAKLVDRDQNGQFFLACPKCRQATPVPVGGVASIQAAFQINQLLTLVEEHKKVPVTTANYEKAKSNYSLIVCPEHGGKEVELYCETCEETICWECIMKGSKHHSHKYEKISIAFDGFKEEIKCSLDPIKQHLETTNKALLQLDACRCEISDKQESIEADIHKSITRLHETLDIRKTELIDQLNQLTTTKLRSLATQREHLEKIQRELSCCLQFMNEIIETGNQREALFKKSTMVKQVDELTASFQPDKVEPNTSADMVFLALSDLTTMCQKYGRVYAAAGTLDLTVDQELNTATVGKKSSILFNSPDSSSKPCEVLVTFISCELVSEIVGTRVRGMVKTKGEKLYEVSYKPTIKGMHQLHIKVQGQHIMGSPYPVSVRSPVEKLGSPILTIRGLSIPMAVAVNQRGEVVVTEYEGHSISVFSSSGEKLQSFGTKGSGKKQFQSCHGVAIDSDGNIFVADRDNNRIQKFTAQGKFLAAVGTQGSEPLQFHQPCGIAYSASNKRVYVVDAGNFRIQVLDSDLNYLNAFGKKGKRKGEFENSKHIACDSIGNIYISECGSVNNQYIQVFSADGKFLRVIGEEGREELNCPYGVAIDCSGRVYVSERDNHRISIFTSEGEFVTSFGGLGKRPGQFFCPYGVAVDSSGVVYVCDRHNRIQLF